MNPRLPRFLALLLALPLLAQAQVNVTVNASQAIRTVDERVFGANSVIWDGQASSAQTIAMLQAAGLRTVRVPGGSLSDEYHWRVNKTLNNTWTWSTSFGRSTLNGAFVGNGFVDIIAGLGAHAMVTVNYGTGTPEEAAALVAYLNSPVGSNVAIGSDGAYDWGTSGTWAAMRAAQAGPADDMAHLRIGRAAPLGARYFEIGNECYGTWETDQQAVQHDPTTYANRAQLYMAKMRAVDPTIKIGVVVVRSDENNSYKNWTPVMLARLKVLNAIPDFIIYHRYPQAPGQETDAGLLQQAGGNTSGWTYTANDLRNQLTTHLGAAGWGVEIIVTENNSVYSNPGKQSTSLVNGLFLADSIANVMKTEIGGFMWWAVRNGPPPTATTNQGAALYGWRMYGDYGMISTPFTEGATTYQTSYYDPHPTYYAMKLLQYFARQGDTVVTAASSSNLLSVFSVRRANGSLALLVLNKDPVNALTANIAVTGFTPGANATVYSYGKPQDTGGTDLAVTNLAIPGSTFTASFASYSMTVLSLSSTPTTVPPAFTLQPLSQTATVGSPVTFTVAASGTPAPTFQWRKNGVNIAGATNATYAITHVSAADAGAYTVVASNSAGSATSNGATLTAILAASDFNADGDPDVLWQNTATGARRLWLMNGTAMGSEVSLGTIGVDWQMAGTDDFNGDGHTDIVWQNTATGERGVWLMSGTGLSSYVAIGTVDASWNIAVVADFNQDDHPDLLWENTLTGERAIWLMNGVNLVGYAAEGVLGLQWNAAGAGDFNGDSKPDIVWQNSLTGERKVWLMNGTTKSSEVSLGFVALSWVIGAVADYNSDGFADVFWQDTSTGEHAIWVMNGTTVAGYAFPPTESASWVVGRIPRRPAASDFNRDGKPDIVWQNSATGDRKIWLMNGGAFGSEVALNNVPTSWQIAATGDLDNNGHCDIVWQNTSTGERGVWLMTGTNLAGYFALGTVSLDWQIVATGDFNADNRTDVLWQNTSTGERSLWLMNGTELSGYATLGNIALDWKIAGVGDFNRDDKPDIIWQNSVTGDRKVWLMNGTVFGSEVSLGNVALSWQIAGVADYNLDGQVDVLWQNTVTGESAVWLMNGTALSGYIDLGVQSPNWQIAN